MLRFGIIKVLFAGMLSMAFFVAEVKSQSPFDGGSLDTSQREIPAPSDGEVRRDDGSVIYYSIKGVKSLKTFSFVKLSAWNLPGRLELQGEPEGDRIEVSGSIDVASTGFPESDRANYVYQVSYLSRAGDKRDNKKVVEKKVNRPFSEKFSFSIPVSSEQQNLSFSISFREDTGPENPMPWSIGVFFSIPPQKIDTAVPWKEAKGSGNAGKVAVMAAAAALAAAALAKRRKKKPDRGKTAGYVLQLSRDTITLARGETETFEVTAWKVDETQATTLATDARLEIIEPQLRGLSISPLTGEGKMVVSVQLTGSPDKAETRVQIKATAGMSTFSTQVRLQLGEYSLEFF